MYVSNSLSNSFYLFAADLFTVLTSVLERIALKLLIYNLFPLLGCTLIHSRDNYTHLQYICRDVGQRQLGVSRMNK